MVSTQKAKTALRNPREVLWELHRRFSMRVRQPESVMDQDWDTLIILDACRFDLFKESNVLPGKLTATQSVASATAEFIKRTFVDRQYSDTVCVTATPKYIKPNAEDSFYDIIHVWKTEWNEKERTVLPKTMTQQVLKAHDKYPNKRVIAHYIPPHLPFIGETGKKIPHEVRFGGDIIRQDKEKPDIWEGFAKGKIDQETVWKAYRENLELTLPHINELMENIEGKLVVTSDHGNGFGEKGVYGHPPRRHIKPLVKVPWLEYQSGSRREINAQTPQSNRESHDAEEVQKRLKDLGYTE